MKVEIDSEIYIFNNYLLNRRLILADVYRARVYHEYFREYIFYFSIYYTSEQQKSGVFTLLCDKACQLKGGGGIPRKTPTI